jgi:hypothetical protein
MRNALFNSRRRSQKTCVPYRTWAADYEAIKAGK